MIYTYRFLDVSEYHKYRDFVKSQDEATLKSYYGYPISHGTIDQLAAGFLADPENNRFIVCEDNDMEIVGFLHIAIQNNITEFGLMVDPKHRGNDISNEMMSRAITWCQNRGLDNIYMHCISWNQPVLHLVKKYGLKIERVASEADATVKLNPPDVCSITREVMMRNTELQKRVLKGQVLSFKLLCLPFVGAKTDKYLNA